MDPQIIRLFGIESKEDIKELMTGQVMFRKSRTKAPGDITNRTIAIIIGVVALPIDSDISDHIQHPVAGRISEDGVLKLYIDLNDKTDYSDEMKGNSLSGIVMSPIWRT
jgi:hypothetical protein